MIDGHPDSPAGVSRGFSSLTERHRTILELVSHGLTNVQIGRELHMSKYTVAQHIKEIFKRTGSINRTDLVARAHESGTLPSRPAEL